MRCPECQALNEAASTACSNCGLILLQTAPKRRSEDYAGQRRRAADRESATCQFCAGEIDSKAIRCRHCSEIVNEDYYRERATRIRSRVNYASWVAYLFGLAALLVFRPVGIVSIGAGLLLSIVYYAIPTEPSQGRSKGRGSFGRFLKNQLRMERVALPIPAFRNKKLIFVGTPLIAAVVGYSANALLLQRPVDQVIDSNSAFQGMKVSAHYQYWVVPGVVVYDLKELSVRQTPLDVHTALSEFASKVRDKRYSRVDISYRGATKFSIDGESFTRLGEEYEKKNYKYVLYEFPRLFGKQVKPPASSPGGRDELLQFHRQWYGNDALTRTIANGLF